MNYIVKKLSYEGSPILVLNEDQTPSHVEQSTTIIVGVEGASDDFNVSTGTTIRLELTDTIAVCMQKVVDGAAAFVAEKYPNT